MQIIPKLRKRKKKEKETICHNEVGLGLGKIWSPIPMLNFNPNPGYLKEKQTDQ